MRGFPLFPRLEDARQRADRIRVVRVRANILVGTNEILTDLCRIGLK
jgi:hypothetical protein